MANEADVIIRKILQFKYWIEVLVPELHSYFIGTYNVP